MVGPPCPPALRLLRLSPWSPDSWRALPALHQPSYPDAAAGVRELRAHLSGYLHDRVARATCSPPVAHPLASFCAVTIKRDARASLVERAGAALVTRPPLLEAVVRSTPYA